MKKSTIAIFVVLAIAMYIGYQWEELDTIRNGVHAVLDPTFGTLIALNNFIGFLLVVAIISFILMLAQKYLTDQKEMKRLRSEQKEIQKQMKEFKEHPEKIQELTKKQFELMGPMMHLTFRAFTYTGIPIILFFRWFQETLSPIYGGWWLLYYLIASMVFTTLFKKWFKVA